MLYLHAVVQSLGVKGRWQALGRGPLLKEAWRTCQWSDDKKIELARLIGSLSLFRCIWTFRHLRSYKPACFVQKLLSHRISWATSFDTHRGRFHGTHSAYADLSLPELTLEALSISIRCCPSDRLIIQVVSVLRTHGVASNHVGGANRTIINLAQQLLINPAVNLADQPIGLGNSTRSGSDLVRGQYRVRSCERRFPPLRELEPLWRSRARGSFVLMQYVRAFIDGGNIAGSSSPWSGRVGPHCCCE